MRGARSSACPLCPRGRSLALSHPVIVGFSQRRQLQVSFPQQNKRFPWEVFAAEIKARPGAGGMRGELPPAPFQVPAWLPMGTAPS